MFIQLNCSQCYESRILWPAGSSLGCFTAAGIFGPRTLYLQRYKVGDSFAQHSSMLVS